MDSAVSHEYEKPIYYKRDLFFTRLVVDRVKVDMMGHQLDYTVYYAGTSKYSLQSSILLSFYVHIDSHIMFWMNMSLIVYFSVLDLKFITYMQYLFE